MGFLLPAFKYPPARPDGGYWNPVTSTINWCEEDYYATIYSAEIVNALTNLTFLFLGFKGIVNCLTYKHDSVFLVAFLGYTLVGSGSFAFHSTLKYPMQLVDELSMIYTACLMCYATFSFSKSGTVRTILGVGLASLAIFITLYYHYLEEPLFHQNAFALLTAVILFRSMYVMEVNIRPSLRKKYGTIPERIEQSNDQKLSNERRDIKIVNEMWMLVAVGLSTFLGGFAIWALDIRFCSTIRRWRHDVGLPWGIFLEGHGWWHIMTGIGSYFYIVWAVWLRHCLNDRQDQFVLKWPTMWSLPEVVPLIEAEKSAGYRMAAKANGYTNGHAKIEDRKSM